MYRMVKLSLRLPELGVWVTLIDSAGEHRVYRRTELGWNMRDADGVNSPNNNLDLVYWLEKVDKTFDSEALIGNVRARFEELSDYNFDWKSFYNAWLEGRFVMLYELG